jgi:hypothetical protein
VVTPSVAVAALELVPFTAQPAAGGYVSGNDAGEVAACIAIAEAVPATLLRLEPADYASLLGNLATMRSAVATWQTQGPKIGALDFAVLRDVRNQLAKCPDRAVADPSPDFRFLGDAELEADLVMDVGEINVAIANAEWKSATVIAGSVVEALLLWKLLRQAAQTTAAIASLRKKDANKKIPTDPLDGTLHNYIEIAKEAGWLADRTVTLASLAKDFRNLIHPGRPARLAQKPDRSTALAAAAAMEAVLAELRAAAV